MQSPNGNGRARRGRKRKTAEVVDLDTATAFKLDIAALVASRRTSKKTRKIYAGKLNKWIQYFDQKYPQLVIREAEADDPENIKVYVDVDELTAAHVNAFLGTVL